MKDKIYFLFFDMYHLKIYSLEGKNLKRTVFKTPSKEKVDKLYYSYSYDLEKDVILYYPLDSKRKSITESRTIFGNVIDLNMLWKGYLKEISVYLPKMGKLFFILGKIKGLGSADLENREIFLEDCKEIFKERTISVADFYHSVFAFLISLNSRFNKNIVLLANTFSMICDDNGISTLNYSVSELINNYANRMDLSELFYGKYELSIIVEALLLNYVTYKEESYVIRRQNQEVTITMDLVKRYYLKLLVKFVDNIKKCNTNKPLYVIDVTSKRNRLLDDITSILNTSPYTIYYNNYADFIEDSLKYAYLVVTKNNISSMKKAKMLYLAAIDNMSSSDKLIQAYSDGINLYSLAFFMGEKSANSYLGEFIKKIKFDK